MEEGEGEGENEGRSWETGEEIERMEEGEGKFLENIQIAKGKASIYLLSCLKG